jgi:hypothetical protein
MAKPGRVDRGQKMTALHQHVAGDGQLGTGAGLQQGAIVTHAQHSALGRALEIALDQPKLAELSHGVPGGGRVAGAGVVGLLGGQKKLRGTWRQRRPMAALTWPRATSVTLWARSATRNAR